MAEPPRERWLPIPGWEGLYEVSDQGHAYTPENTVRGARPTDRSCRTCRNDRARKRYAAKKVA